MSTVFNTLCISIIASAVITTNVIAQPTQTKMVGIELNDKIYVNESNRDYYWKKYRGLEAEYPKIELRFKKSACVTVMFTITKEGRVYNPSVVSIYPEDNGRFRKSALRAIKKYRFKPSDINADKKSIVTTQVFRYIASDQPTDRSHTKMAADLEKEFESACEVVFEKKPKSS